MDVELGGRLAGRGEAERCVERCGWGEERAGVDEAEGRGREGGRQVWADEGVEGDGVGGARVGDGEGEVGEGGREADYEGEGGDGGRKGGGFHCCWYAIQMLVGGELKVVLRQKDCTIGRTSSAPLKGSVWYLE